MLGLQPEERGHAIALLAREMFTQSASALGARRTPSATSSRSSRCPARTRRSPPTRGRSRSPRRSPPITGATCCSCPDEADLFAALISNRSALLVCAGAMAADPSMRALLERDRGLLRWIVQDRAGGVLDRGARPQDRQGSRHRSGRRRRGADLGSARRGEGDAAGGFPPRAAHARLGPAGVVLRLGRHDVAGAHGGGVRRAADRGADRTGARVLRRVSIAPTRTGSSRSIRSCAARPIPGSCRRRSSIADGAVAPPAEQWFWEALFDRSDITRRSAASLRARAGVAGHAGVAGAEDLRARGAKERRDRFEMVRFAQGVFTNVDGDRADRRAGRARRLSPLSRPPADARSHGHHRRRASTRAPSKRRGGSTTSCRAATSSTRSIAFQSSLAILERARLTQRDRRAPPRSGCVLSLADVVDPPATSDTQDAAVHRHHAVDDHDAARRAAAAGAARSSGRRRRRRTNRGCCRRWPGRRRIPMRRRSSGKASTTASICSPPSTRG